MHVGILENQKATPCASSSRQWTMQSHSALLAKYCQKEVQLFSPIILQQQYYTHLLIPRATEALKHISRTIPSAAHLIYSEWHQVASPTDSHQQFYISDFDQNCGVIAKQCGCAHIQNTRIYTYYIYAHLFCY